MKKIFTFLILALLLPSLSFSQLYKNPKAPVEKRVQDLLSRMTLDEKLDYIGGVDAFYIRDIPRLGLPRIKMSDGPVGLRNDGNATAYPAGVLTAATWDVNLVARLGKALGQDARARGVHILLGPGVNIYRAPMAGRNFEYFGEDPFLAGKLAADYVKGVQSQGVVACVKHFAGNNQEWDRYNVSSNIDERTLHEIYLPAFKAAVNEGKVGAVMNSYNLLNGEHATQNNHLNNEILKRQWGFDGILMSDWESTHDGLAAARGGLDIEMPSAKFMNSQVLKPAIESGQLSEKVIDDKIRRILRVIFRFGFYDHSQQLKSIPLDNAKSAAVALDLARGGMVLLKNDKGLLPLSKNRIKSIAVVGPDANCYMRGGGSSIITPFHSVTTLKGIQNFAGSTVKVNYAADPAAAVNAAAASDVAVVCVGFGGEQEEEGYDRTFALPAGQDSLIMAVAKVNPNTIVVVNAGGNVDMQQWLPNVKGLLQAWYPGQEGGTAIAEILFGKVNPSGKLPDSFEKRWEDNPTFNSYYAVKGSKEVDYKEGLLVGYRYYDTKKVEPQFPFGFGLSYSSFAYSNLKIASHPVKGKPGYTVSFTVKNTGKRDGAEVAQVYVSALKSKVERPEKELKGFMKVFLKAGEMKQVSVNLDSNAFAYYQVSSGRFVVDKGAYKVIVGASSRDLRLKDKVTIAQGVNL